MTTWIDPELGDALTTAGLIALGQVVASDPTGARVRLLRVFAGDEAAGSVVAIDRARAVGHGHEASTLPHEAFLFVVQRGQGGRYLAFTDSYWWFPISEAVRVHLPIRDPFTRAYVLCDDFAELVQLMRDRSLPRAGLLDRLVARLQAAPVQATQPIEVNDQIIALEALSHLGSERYAPAAIPLLASPHFQIRWSSARALGTCGGRAAQAALLDQVATETAPPVQAALGEALFALADDPGTRAAIVQAIPRMFDKAMPYARNVMSPIMNLMPSPRDTLVAVVMKLDGEPGCLAALRARAGAYLAAGLGGGPPR
jgi:HEAT repeats